jgi:hypothetical protein
MRKKTSYVIALLVLLVALACQTLMGSGAKGTGGPTDSLFTDANNPINVTVKLDAQLSQTAVISSQGGQLSAQDAAGNRFTLDIPAGALTMDTQITMTPVNSIDNLPLSKGLVAAVQFQPDGLFLYQDAILTIETVQNIPVENQILFGYLGEGKDLHLAAPGPDYPKIQVRVPHFSGFGLGSGIATDRANLLLSRAADHEVRLQQQLAQALSQERTRQLLGIENGGDPIDMNGFFESYYGLVVRPRMLAAGSSCANGKLAIQTLLSYERQRQLLGIGDDASSSSRVQEAAALMDTVYKKCREEAIKDCQEKVDPRILIQFELGYERQKQLLGSESNTTLTQTVEEAYKTCGAAFTAQGQGGDTTVTGQICRLDEPFELQLTSSVGPTGSAKFTPTSLTSGTFADQMGGGGISESGQGTYQVTDLLSSPILNGQGNGCVTVAGINSCNDYSFEANLTFIPGGCH